MVPNWIREVIDLLKAKFTNDTQQIEVMQFFCPTLYIKYKISNLCSEKLSTLPGGSPPDSHTLGIFPKCLQFPWAAAVKIVATLSKKFQAWPPECGWSWELSQLRCSAENIDINYRSLDVLPRRRLRMRGGVVTWRVGCWALTSRNDFGIQEGPKTPALLSGTGLLLSDTVYHVPTTFSKELV